MRGFFREDQARLVVGKRVLLPVNKVGAGFDLERVRQDLAAAMRGRAQADHLRAEVDWPVVDVMGNVVQRGMDGHGLVSVGLKKKLYRRSTTWAVGRDLS